MGKKRFECVQIIARTPEKVSEWTAVELDIPVDIQDLNGKREAAESKRTYRLFLVL